MASISFKHVEKTYPGNVTVVPDLNLEIQDKEFVILVGPSGCGKPGDYVLAAAAQGSLTVSALAYSLLLKLRAMP